MVHSGPMGTRFDTIELMLVPSKGPSLSRNTTRAIFLKVILLKESMESCTFRGLFDSLTELYHDSFLALIISLLLSVGASFLTFFLYGQTLLHPVYLPAPPKWLIVHL